MKLSIIIATIGRSEINLTLNSITPQLQPGDEVLICRDNSGDWGMSPRNKYMYVATGDVLMFMDDDDMYMPGAFEAVRSCLSTNPKPHIFRMKRNGGKDDVIHKDHVLERGNVSTQMIVVPNDPCKLGAWAKKYDGDFDFIESTIKLYDGEVVWREEIIAVWKAAEER